MARSRAPRRCRLAPGVVGGGGPRGGTRRRARPRARCRSPAHAGEGARRAREGRSRRPSSGILSSRTSRGYCSADAIGLPSSTSGPPLWSFFCSRSSGGFRNARGGLSIDCTRAPLTLQLASPGCGRESATRRVRNLLSAGRYRSKRWKARAGIHAECGSLHGNGVILPRIRERLGISCPA